MDTTTLRSSFLIILIGGDGYYGRGSLVVGTKKARG